MAHCLTKTVVSVNITHTDEHKLREPDACEEAPVGLNESEHLDLGSFRNPRNTIAMSTLPGVGNASSPGTIRYGSIHNLAYDRVVRLSEQGPLLNGDQLESLRRRLFKLPDSLRPIYCSSEQL
jgi:hypothetical protein